MHCLASGTWAQEVVWHSPPNVNLSAFIDQDFGDFPDFSIYLLGHVRLDRDTFVHDITTYYTNGANLWPIGEIEAVLNIIPQGGGLPPNDYDPTGDQDGGNGLKVLADMALGATGFELTASLNGDLTLPAGNYWFGLTPKIDFGVFGREFHLGTDIYDKNTAARNPGGGFGVGTEWFEAGPVFGGIDWGMAITITGKNVPTPGALALLGVAGLLGARRRRRQ